MPKKEPFIVNRIKSIGFAFKGLYILICTEASIQIQFVIAVLVTIAGFYYQLSAIEWALQCICIGAVMGIEGLNTAVEKMADFVHPNYNQRIGLIKDVSAGAVMAVSLSSTIVGGIIYFPKIF